MSMKMKGFLKGLRYISTIFDEEEETEMQIGFPTDVKHVAHIGWDGPTANSPSWINQFKDGESGGGRGGGGGGGPLDSNEVDQQNAPKTRDARLPPQEKRGSTGSDPPLDSPSRRRSDKPRGTRRGASSTSASSTDSPRRSSSSTEPKTKQFPNSTAEGGESTSSTQKTSYRKKPKGSSSGNPSSSRTSNRSKPIGGSQPEASPYSDPGVGQQRRLKGKDTSCQGSVLKNSSEQEDQKALDDVSRGIQAM